MLVEDETQFLTFSLISDDWSGGPVLTRGIYKELSSFSGSLSGFTPKPSPPKQFTIIKSKNRNNFSSSDIYQTEQTKSLSAMFRL